MARYLFTVWPFPGHLNPCLAVAEALRARGHEVAFYTGTRSSSLFAQLGLTHFAAGEDDAVFHNRLKARYSGESGKGVLHLRLMKDVFVGWILDSVPQQVADLEPIVNDWRPDALICDPIMMSPVLVLHERLDLPIAVFSFFAGCLIPGPDAPPFGLGLPRPKTPFTRAQARVASLAVDMFARDVRCVANALRSRYGLSRFSEPLLALPGRMPLYLVATSRDYDFDRHDLPPSVQYVGACLWDKPRHEAPSAWLKDVPDDQPLVYVTEGTAHSFDSAVLDAAMRGLAGVPLRVILTTGSRDPEPLRAVAPSNVRVERFVPHSDLFPRLSAVVTTGGSGTVQAALLAGLPLVVVPMEWDQHDNAQRVVEAGAGVRLSARACTPQHLRATVLRVLHDPSFGLNSRRLGDASRRAGGPDRAATLLESIVHRPEPALAAYAGGEERHV